MFGGVFPPQRRFRHFLARQLTVSTSLVCIYFARFFPSELRHFGGITLLISTVSWEAKGIWDLGSRFFFSFLFASYPLRPLRNGPGCLMFFAALSFIPHVLGGIHTTHITPPTGHCLVRLFTAYPCFYQHGKRVCFARRYTPFCYRFFVDFDLRLDSFREQEDFYSKRRTENSLYSINNVHRARRIPSPLFFHKWSSLAHLPCPITTNLFLWSSS